MSEHSDVEICPACATEWEVGTMKRCGGIVVQEVVELRKENKLMAEALTKIMEKAWRYPRDQEKISILVLFCGLLISVAIYVGVLVLARCEILGAV